MIVYYKTSTISVEPAAHDDEYVEQEHQDDEEHLLPVFDVAENTLGSETDR